MIIYKIENKINNKVYIGLTTKSLSHRKMTHKNSLNSKKNRPLYNSIKKYGWKNFEFSIIEELKDKESLCKREIYWISYYNSTNREYGYNLSSGGEYNTPSIDGRKRISEKLKKRWKTDKKYREKMEKLHIKPNKKQYIKKGPRQFLTETHKKKISIALKNNKNSKSGILHPNAKPVLCIETNEGFENASIASKYIKGNVHKACSNRTKSGNYHWKYISKEEYYNGKK